MASPDLNDGSLAASPVVTVVQPASTDTAAVAAVNLAIFMTLPIVSPACATPRQCAVTLRELYAFECLSASVAVARWSERVEPRWRYFAVSSRYWDAIRCVASNGCNEDAVYTHRSNDVTQS